VVDDDALNRPEVAIAPQFPPGSFPNRHAEGS